MTRTVDFSFRYDTLEARRFRFKQALVDGADTEGIVPSPEGGAARLDMTMLGVGGEQCIVRLSALSLPRSREHGWLDCTINATKQISRFSTAGRASGKLHPMLPGGVDSDKATG